MSDRLAFCDCGKLVCDFEPFCPHCGRPNWDADQMQVYQMQAMVAEAQSLIAPAKRQ